MSHLVLIILRAKSKRKKTLYRYETQEPRTFFIPFLLRTNFHMGLDGGIFVKLPTHIRTYVHHRSESIHFVFCLFWFGKSMPRKNALRDCVNAVRIRLPHLTNLTREQIELALLHYESNIDETVEAFNRSKRLLFVSWKMKIRKNFV